MPVGHALEQVLKIGEGLDVVELGGGDERADGGPAVCTAIRPGKQVVLAAERNRTDGTFDGVGVEFDASIFEEYAKCLPAVQCVPDCLSKAAARRDVGKLRIQPELHGPDQRQRPDLPAAPPGAGGL